MTHTSKGELSDLNLTSGQWHYVENASDGGLRQSLGDDNCQGDFAEAIRRELKQRSARTYYLASGRANSSPSKATLSRIDRAERNHS